MGGGWWARLACCLFLCAAVRAAAESPPPAATLDQSRLPSAGEHATLLHVAAPGRFALKAQSPTGTALQLVDMLGGPSDLAGAPGAGDGRIDQLLDAGTYKVRLFGADGAQGETRLSVVPFRDRAPPQAAPAPGTVASGELADLQQQIFRLTVAVPGRVRIEAAGRGLHDLRLWREDGDLVPLAPAGGTIEPLHGHPLQDLVLEGAVEAGAYRIAAYGGPPLAWGDGNTAQPLYLRVGASPALADGWTRGRIGPFGSELYAVGPHETSWRLDLPDPAPVQLSVSADHRVLGQAAIAKNSREPDATAAVPPADSGIRLLRVDGAEGQDFAVRGFRLTGSRHVATPGNRWFAAQTIGAGGDELPATGLLVRSEYGQKPVAVASAAPHVGPGQAWRWQFNLRGASSLLFEATADGPIAVRAQGVAVQAAVDTLGGERAAPRANGTAPTEWDLAAGWYVLRLTPPANAAGPLDLTLGPPGVVPATPAAKQPPAPVLAFGEQTVAPGQQLQLWTGDGPGVAIDLVARQLPVDLETAPLTVTLSAGAALELPVRMPLGGSFVATAIGEGPVAAELRDPHDEAKTRIATAAVPAADRARTLILAWHAPEPVAAPAAAAQPPAAPLAAGHAQFFDLDKDAVHSFGLAIAEGGLYRVETLGRLKTEGWIGTPFLPEIDHQTGNGSGQNLLLQDYLRAGRYRVTVAARDSAGRAGILANPAILRDGGTLLPGGSVRATMPAGSGVRFAIEIAQAGNYHLDLLGLGRKFTARLEDAEGWPILGAGDLSSLDRRLTPGHYRLMVLPQAVEARVIARLDRVEPAPELKGHGPHKLPFDAQTHFQWREPAGRDEARTPDQWDFALEGPAQATIDIGDGMVAELRRADRPEAPPIGRLVYKSGFKGELAAGQYRITATSLGRNDRLDYTIALHTAELQPGAPRRITLPATVPFAIARDRVVSLTSFGDVDVKAVLRAADGTVLGRYDDRTDDWNIAVSRTLPAGHYRLDLSQVAPPPGAPAPDANANSDADQDSDDEEQRSNERTETAAPEEPTGGQSEIRLALPREAATVAAPENGSATVTGAEVHRLAVPPAGAGQLLVAGAASSAELVLALERRNETGGWQVAALDQGRAPVVAVVADGDPNRPWRLAAWTVDGGSEPVHLAIRAVTSAAQPVGSVVLQAVALDGVPGPLAAGLVAAPGARLLRLDHGGDGMLAGSSPGEALRSVDGAIVIPQSERVWLLARGAPAKLQLSPAGGSTLALTLPAGGSARLPAAAPAEGRLRFWLAESGFGQPGVTAGRGMGVAPGAAFALAGPDPAKVWNAGDGEALRLRLAALDLALLPEQQVSTSATATVPAKGALPVWLPSGGKRLRLDLPAGVAAIAGWHSAGAVTAWTGHDPASWLIEGDWNDLLLVNTGAQPLPATLAASPLGGAQAALRPGSAEKRFFGAAGTLSLPFEAKPGQRLVVAGAAATVVGADGRVARGRQIALSGPGRVMLRHPSGLVAAWIEGAGVSPWPAAPPQSVSLPAELPLAGPTMALSFAAKGPALLHARTTAPVIAILVRGGRAEAPVVFAAGAEFHRYLAEGAAELRLVSPDDGPLSGSLELDTTPVVPAGEGLGPAVAVAPGGTALFGFDAVADGPVGVGVRADPDRAFVRLLDADGKPLGSGVAMLRRLKPGHYLIEARLPPDAPTALVEPAVIGIKPRPNGPPAEVMRHYLELVGMVPTTAR